MRYYFAGFSFRVQIKGGDGDDEDNARSAHGYDEQPSFCYLGTNTQRVYDCRNKPKSCRSSPIINQTNTRNCKVQTEQMGTHFIGLGDVAQRHLQIRPNMPDSGLYEGRCWLHFGMGNEMA